MAYCLMHEDPDGELLYICNDCLPRARTALKDLKVQIEIGFIDPDDADDPAVAGYRVLSHVLEGRAF